MQPSKRLPNKLVLAAVMAVPACFSPEQKAATSDTETSSASVDTTEGPPVDVTGGTTEDDHTTDPPSGSTGGDMTSTTGDPTSGEDSGSTSTGAPGDDDSSSTGGESSSSGDEPVSCGDGGVCVPSVPEGWNGPVATRTIGIEEDIPPCGGESYTDLQVSDAFGALQASDFECDCECNPGSLSCTGEAELLLSSYPPMQGLSPCTSPSYVYNETIPSGSPQSVTIPMNGIRGIVLADDPTANIAGTCTPNPTTEPTPAGFGTRTIACGTFDAEPTGCGDGLCVPQPAAPYDAGVCIWAEGDLECPAGFDERTVFHSDYADTRSCSTCSCSAPTGSCSNANIRIRGWCEDGPCFGGSCGPGGTFPCEEQFDGTIADFSTCESIGAQDFCTPLCDDGELCASCTSSHTLQELRDITYQAGSPSATCPPIGGDPVGTVSGIEPLTMCCSA